jgi:hypothetical protein
MKNKQEKQQWPVDWASVEEWRVFGVVECVARNDRCGAHQVSH